jgi:hypothetical protein
VAGRRRRDGARPRLFKAEGGPHRLRLAESRATSKGVVLLTYTRV